MEDAYVMGHRLIAFLGSALPRHPAYTTWTKERAISEGHLLRIQKQMKEIAILIDEEHLNRYITNDFDPVFEEDEEEKKEEDTKNHFMTDHADETTWEAFAGWSSVDCDSPPGGVDTDESSQDFDSEIDFLDFDAQRRVKSYDPPDAKDPEIEDMISDEDSDTESDDMADPFVIHCKPPVLSTSILRKIAREAVRYESDSEAADSWAQDGTGNASDTTSSEVGLLNQSSSADPPVPFTSCDPARLAFRAIMNKHSQQLQSLQLEMERLLSDSPSPDVEKPETNIPTPTDDTPEQFPEQENSQDSEETKEALRSHSVGTAMTYYGLPPPAISAPQLLLEWEESPTPSPPPPTPNNSPDDLHPAIRWGIQLRRTRRLERDLFL